MTKLLSKIWVIGKWVRFQLKDKIFINSVDEVMFKFKTQLLIRLIEENDVRGIKKLLYSLSATETLYKELLHIEDQKISFPVYSITQSAEAEQVLYDFGVRNRHSEEDGILLNNLLDSDNYPKIERLMALGFKKDEKNSCFYNRRDLGSLASKILSKSSTVEKQQKYIKLIKEILIYKSAPECFEMITWCFSRLAKKKKEWFAPNTYEAGGGFDLLIPFVDINFECEAEHALKGNENRTLLQLAIINGTEEFVEKTLFYYKNDIKQLAKFNEQLTELNKSNFNLDLALKTTAFDLIKTYMDKIILAETLPVMVVPTQPIKKKNKI